MHMQQRVLLVRAFRQLQEGVLKGLELVDKMGGGDIDRPEDLEDLSVHLGKLGEHVKIMEDTVTQYAGANALLGRIMSCQQAEADLQQAEAEFHKALEDEAHGKRV